MKMLFKVMVLCSILTPLLISFLKQDLSVWLWLALNSQRASYLCLPSVGIKSVDHNTGLITSILIVSSY